MDDSEQEKINKVLEKCDSEEENNQLSYWFENKMNPVRMQLCNNNILHAICIVGCDHLLEYALDVFNEDKYMENDLGHTPIHCAAEYGNEKCLAILLKRKGSFLNNRSFTNDTAIMLAIKRTHYQCVMKLLNFKGTCVKAINNQGETALMLLAKQHAHHFKKEFNAYSIFKDIMNDGGLTLDQDFIGNNVFHILCTTQNENMLKLVFKKLYTEGMKQINLALILNIKNQKGQTALMIAMSQHNANIIDMLLKNGADPYLCINESGWSAFHLASVYRNAKGLALLLDFAKTKLPVDNKKNTILHLACNPAYGSFNSSAVQCVELILKSEFVDINAVNYKGRTAMHYAVKSKYSYVYSLLSESFAAEIEDSDSEVPNKIYKASYERFTL